MRLDLNQLAAAIHEWCASEDIDLLVSWIWHSQNEDKDRLSHFKDLDDWGFSLELLNLLQRRWFPCSVNFFTSIYNHKLPSFNSCYSSPDCEAVDAFKQEWTHEDNWLVPPPGLISRVFQHLQADRASGILVCPHWKSAPFRPFLFHRHGPTSVVKDFLVLQKGARFLIAGNQSGLVFAPNIFRGPLLAILLDASQVRK